MVVAVDGEGEVHPPLARRIQHNHVDLDVRRTDGCEHSQRRTGSIRQAADGDSGLIAVESNTGNQGCFHGGVLCGDERAFTVLEAERNAQLHVVLGGEFHRPQMQHARALPSQLQHFLERQTR